MVGYTAQARVEENSKQTFALGYAIAEAFYWTLASDMTLMAFNQPEDLLITQFALKI